MSKRFDPHEILELPRTATIEEIKRSYRDLVKVWHPDRFPEDSELRLRATEKLKLINLAYEKLIDNELGEESRKKQDEFERVRDDNYGFWRYRVKQVTDEKVWGRIVETTEKLLVTKPVDESVEFGSAKSDSLSFSPNAENFGTRGIHSDYALEGGLVSGYDNRYDFRDGSYLVIAHLKRDTLFNILEPLHERWASSLAILDWEGALIVAHEFVKLAPEDAIGYIRCAYALHALESTVEALQVLKTVADVFPTNSTLIYNMACYECRLGNISNAKKQLKRVRSLIGSHDLKAMVIADTDLEPLHKWVNSFWF